jgi:hypothetical protein
MARKTFEQEDVGFLPVASKKKGKNKIKGKGL